VIGEVTDGGVLRALHHGESVGEIPAELLTDEAPRYEIEQRAHPHAPARVDEELATRPRTWIFRQYDHLVGSRTVRRPGLDAAVLRLRPSLRGIAVSLDGPPAGCRDPFAAGALATLEAARNVACAGGRPLGITDCLNFGNPEKPAIAWELAQAIDGIAEAANALRIPVVSGNVSLYNETDGRAIPPTPVVGCVGLVEDVTRVPSGWRSGDVVLAVLAPEGLDISAEAAVVEFLWRAAPLLSLAHDVSEGGIAVALAEAAAWSGAPADVVPEDNARAVIACSPANVGLLGGVPLQRIGVVL
jgi:phosphoribosylformylglycinamidine synthase